MNASHIDHTDYSALNGIHDSDRRDDGLSDNTVPVLIVGGGPTGLLQAYMLSQLGGECCRPHLQGRNCC